MSPEHTLQFIHDTKNKEIYTEVFLNHYRPLWKRIWIAVKYNVGYKCKYGHWDTFMMRNEDLNKIQKILLDNQ